MWTSVQSTGGTLPISSLVKPHAVQWFHSLLLMIVCGYVNFLAIGFFYALCYKILVVLIRIVYQNYRIVACSIFYICTSDNINEPKYFSYPSSS